MAVPLRFPPGGQTVEPGTPVPLFVTRVASTLSGGSGEEYVVSPDGQRFLMNALSSNARSCRSRSSSIENGRTTERLRERPLVTLRRNSDEQLAHCLRLFLLHPVPGPVDQMHAAHVGARGLLHPLHGAGVLIDAPVALSTDEERRHINRAAGKSLELGGVPAARPDAIALQAALESGPSVLRRCTP